MAALRLARAGYQAAHHQLRIENLVLAVGLELVAVFWYTAY